MDSSFYITAPSNASMEHYPNNSGGNYKMDLPETLNLSSDWEVGLSQVSFRNDWENVVKEDIWLRLDKSDLESEEKHAVRWINSYQQKWSSFHKKCKDSDFYIRIGMYDDCMKYTPEIKLDWLDSTRIPTFYDFVSKLNETIRTKAVSEAKWPESYVTENCLPQLTIPQPRPDNPFLIRKDDLHFLVKFLVPNWPHSSLTEEEYRTQRLLTKEARKNNKKRVFAMDDLYLGWPLKNILHVIGLYIGIEHPVKTVEEAKKLKIYQTKYADRYYPSYDISGLNECAPWNRWARLYQDWPLHLPKIGTERKYIIGKQHHIKESGYYTNKKEMLHDVEGLIKEAVKEASGEVIKVKLNLEKSKIAPELEHLKMTIGTRTLLKWRIQMSTALYRVLGITSKQLEENVYIIPNICKINGKVATNNGDVRHLKEIEWIAETTSQSYVDISRNVDSLWIYSNIVKPSIVGHSFAPLLRVVPIKSSKRDEANVITFTHPYYFPLAIHTVSDLEIRIYNTYGQAPIRFTNDVICLLHFRKRPPTTIKARDDGPTPAKQMRIASQ